MKAHIYKALLTLVLLAVWQQAAAQGTAFTYQGRLTDGTNAANGSYDLSFSLFDGPEGENQTAGPLVLPAVAVSNGLFTVTLDFGPGAFTGAACWLEIGVRTNDDTALTTFTTLSPRQSVNPAPYAITAGNLSGPLTSNQLAGAYMNMVALNNPSNNFTGNGAGLMGVSSSFGTNFNSFYSASVSLPVYGANCITITGASGNPAVNLTYYWDQADSWAQGEAVWSNGVYFLYADQFNGRWAIGTNAVDQGALEGVIYRARAGIVFGTTSSQALTISNDPPTWLWLAQAGGDNRFETNMIGSTLPTSYATDHVALAETLTNNFNATTNVTGMIFPSWFFPGYGGDAFDNLGLAWYDGYPNATGQRRGHIWADFVWLSLAAPNINFEDGWDMPLSGPGGTHTNFVKLGNEDQYGHVFIERSPPWPSMSHTGNFTNQFSSARPLAFNTEAWDGLGQLTYNSATITAWPAPMGDCRTNFPGAELHFYSGYPSTQPGTNYDYGLCFQTAVMRTNGWDFFGFLNLSGAELRVANNPGQPGQILTSAGPGAAPYWATPIPVIGLGGTQSQVSNYAPLSAGNPQPAASGARTSLYLCQAMTTNATETETIPDGTGARLVVPVNSTWAFDILVTGRAANGDSAAFQFRGAIANNNGTARLLGAPAKTVLGADVAGWDANVYPGGTDGVLLVDVTGAANTAIRWAASVRTSEVTY